MEETTKKPKSRKIIDRVSRKFTGVDWDRFFKHLLPDSPWVEIADMPYIWMYFLFICFYGGMLSVLGYFLYSQYELNRTQTFISLQNNAGVCDNQPSLGTCCEVPLTVTGDYLADTNGYWSTEPQFSYVNSAYGVTLAGVTYSNQQWTQIMNNVVNQVEVIGRKGKKRDLAWNLVSWDSYSAEDRSYGYFRFYSSGDAGITYNKHIYDIVYGAKDENCAYFYDWTAAFNPTTASLDITVNLNFSFPYEPYYSCPYDKNTGTSACYNYCPETFSFKQFGYDPSASSRPVPPAIALSLDMNAISTSMAINYNMMTLDHLVNVKNDQNRINLLSQMNSSKYITQDLINSTSSYYDTLNAPTDPIYCTTFNDPTITVPACFVRIGNILAYAVTTSWGYYANKNSQYPKQCKYPSNSTQEKYYCNLFDVVVALIYYPNPCDDISITTANYTYRRRLQETYEQDPYFDLEGMVNKFAMQDSPTEFPTDFPTEIPTTSPSEFPTQLPTENPTFAPSDSPSVSPTDYPTLAPGDASTVSPTDYPTLAPADTSTASPTDYPTLAPGDASTVSPTDYPTLAPGDSSTVSPTDYPTLAPGDSSTVSPTDYPTLAPGDSSTVSPTDYPTDSPTISPTDTGSTNYPTYEPTDSPTNTPTDSLSDSPSIAPTDFPTNDPSYTPTDSPTLEPTYEPSSRPTLDPTFEPTESPTYDPTSDPTYAPFAYYGSYSYSSFVPFDKPCVDNGLIIQFAKAAAKAISLDKINGDMKVPEASYDALISLLSYNYSNPSAFNAICPGRKDKNGMFIPAGCAAIAIEFYGGAEKEISEYYYQPDLNNNQFTAYSVLNKLANNPPTSLIQQYYSCVLGVKDSFIQATGIAFSNATLYVGLGFIGLVFLIKFYLNHIERRGIKSPLLKEVAEEEEEDRERERLEFELKELKDFKNDMIDILSALKSDPGQKSSVTLKNFTKVLNSKNLAKTERIIDIKDNEESHQEHKRQSGDIELTDIFPVEIIQQQEQDDIINKKKRRSKHVEKTPPPEEVKSDDNSFLACNQS